MGETEVTQALWYAVMGYYPNSNYGQGDNYPAYGISYKDCQEFVQKLNEKTGKNFRMPTEAEWEYAARGGNRSNGYPYAGSNNIDEVAWYMNNSDRQIHPVARKQPNELGLYDMTGNVHEWCYDWYGAYSSSAQTDPTGPYSGTQRVFRGGSLRCLVVRCRTALRFYGTPANRDFDKGFRLAL